MSTRITVCGAHDQIDAGFTCILPPSHIEHTRTDSGVVHHKHVDEQGSSIGFVTTPPGYVAPKLTDLAGLFTPADTNHLCSTHWTRYIRNRPVADWWDETCEYCDRDQARPLFPELAEVAATELTRADAERERLSRQDWAVEAMRLDVWVQTQCDQLNDALDLPPGTAWADAIRYLYSHRADAEAQRTNHLREGLVAAAKLPVDVDDEVLVAEIEARFKGTVRAVVGHSAVLGQPLCECGKSMPTRGDWFAHVEDLRAQGVPTATITPAEKDGSR